MANHYDKILLPTAYLPPIEYFVYFVNAENIHIELYETYPKQTYRNRCKIYSANDILPLSIPVSKISGNSTKIKDIQINHLYSWQKSHWRAIESAYNASPYFMYFKDELKEFYTQPYQSLYIFNTQLLKQIAEFIGCSKEIYFTKNFNKEVDEVLDLRNHFNPKKENSTFVCQKYFQVFDEKHGFRPNLSIIDLLFSEGPNTLSFLKEIALTT